MHLKEELKQILPTGEEAIRLEAIEEFLDAAVQLEQALHKINTLIDDKKLDKALIDIKKESSATVIIQTFLKMKKIITDLT